MTRPDESQGRRENSPPAAKHPLPASYWRHLQWLAVLALAAATVALVSGNGKGSTAAAGQAAAPTGSPAATDNPAAAASAAAVDRRATAALHAQAVTPETALAAMRVPPKLAAALKSWDAGRRGAALAAVSADIANATQAGGLKLYAPMRLACVSLGTAVTDARAEPPMPDAAMQKLYATGLGTLAAAAADCRAGISAHLYGDEDIQTHENQAVLHRSASELAVGTRELDLATVKISAVTRH